MMKKDFEVFTFPQGIPGFETYKKFKLVREEDAPLAQLLAVDDENIGFIMQHPETVISDYHFTIDDISKSILGLEEVDQTEDSAILEMWAIITLNQADLLKSTINMRAPILLNLDQNLGLQMILEDEWYTQHYLLFKDFKSTKCEKGVK